METSKTTAAPWEASNGAEARSGPTRMKVLVALDGTSQAFQTVKFVSEMLPDASDIRLLTVLSDGLNFETETPWGPLSDSRERAAQVASLRMGAFGEARRILAGKNARVSASHRYGYPADEILSEARAWNAGMIIVGHRNGAGRLLGSVANAIVRRSTLPVLVVPND
jgi:nucleotide-binding universal stress UspA family protein